MAWVIFGGYFLYTEHAPWWIQAAFLFFALVEFAQGEEDRTHATMDREAGK